MNGKKETNTEDVSIISGGVKIEGTLTSDGNVRIDGAVKGNVIVNGNLTIGQNAKLQGEIKASHITFGGNLEGKISASESIKLEAKSILKGDLVTKRLIVEEGAIFDGQSSMSQQPTTPTAIKIQNERKEEQK